MCRVLLVDDEPRILRFLELRLRLEGHEVITAGSSEDAFALARIASPEIMVVDTTMPGMGGFGSLQKLQPYSNVPIIATSTGSGNAGHAVPLGATAYLAKPYNPDRLVALIRAVLDPGKREETPSRST